MTRDLVDVRPARKLSYPWSCDHCAGKGALRVPFEASCDTVVSAAHDAHARTRPGCAELQGGRGVRMGEPRAL